MKNFVSKINVGVYSNMMRSFSMINFNSNMYLQNVINFSPQITQITQIPIEGLIPIQTIEEKEKGSIKAEFLNKTSKLALRKRKKRKYGKQTSLRYR
jgi:hypothetical protein